MNSLVVEDKVIESKKLKKNNVVVSVDERWNVRTTLLQCCFLRF